MILNQAQKNTLAQRPYYSDLRLSIFQPKVLFGCQVASGSYAVGDMLINYNTVSTGAYTNVVPGTTCYIGSSANKADLGRLRVREATPSTIKFAGNAHTWQIGQYLTVINYHEIWPVYTSAIIAPSNDDYIDYMDTDIVYSNQNTMMGTLICMGPNRAAYLENGSANLYYSASGTWNVLNESLTYLWTFEGGSPGSSTSGTPGYVTYSVPGHYLTSLRTISSSGATGTSYRHVSIYPSKNDFPYKNWGIGEISGSRESGGYYAKMWIRGQLPEIVEGSLIVIQGDHWAGADKLNFGGNAENAQDIFFVGYIIDGSLEYDYQDSKVSFEVLSPSGVMKLKETLSYSATCASGTPARWGAIPDLTWKKSVFFYLRWLTTVLETCDVQIIGDDINSQFFDIDQGNIYDSLNNYVQTKVIGEAVTDLQGKLWIERMAGAINNATGTLPEGLALTNHEWQDIIVVDEQNSQKLSQIEIGAAMFAGSPSGSSIPLLSIAPGLYPSYYGKRDSSIQGLVILNQDALNVLSGNLYAWKTAKYPAVEIKLAGNYRNFDIAPQENVPLTVRPQDTNQRLTWNKKPFVIRDMSWEYNPEKKLILPSMSLHEITQGLLGVTEEVLAPVDYNFPPGPPGETYYDFPWPTPGGIVPVVPPTVTPPPPGDNEGVLCRNDLNAPPNGPYMLGMGQGVITDTNMRIFLPVLGWQGAWMRAGTSSNPTSYLFNGIFEKYDSALNKWVENNDKNAIHVYAIDPYGNRIATGVMDEVLTPGIRSGKFYPPAGANISQIEVELDVTGSPVCTVATIVLGNSSIFCHTVHNGGSPTISGGSGSSYVSASSNLNTYADNPFVDCYQSIELQTTWNVPIQNQVFHVYSRSAKASTPLNGSMGNWLVRRSIVGYQMSGTGILNADFPAEGGGNLYGLTIKNDTIYFGAADMPLDWTSLISMYPQGDKRCTITSGYLWNICAAWFG